MPLDHRADAATSGLPPLSPDDLAALVSVGDAQVSPCGRWVVFARAEVDLVSDDYRVALQLASLDGDVRPLTRGDWRERSPRWSPDGSLVAFFADRADGAATLCVVPRSGGAPRELAALARGASAPVWSPDGSSLLVVVPAATALRATDLSPVMITRARYRADGVGLTVGVRARLLVVPADGGEPRALEAPGDARAPSWSPDGRAVACGVLRDGPRALAEADIWLLDVATGAARQLTRDVHCASSPTWSPDGTLLAFYGCDEPLPGIDDPVVRVWTVSSLGGAPRQLTPGFDRGVAMLRPAAWTPGPIWSRDGRSVTVRVADRGEIHVVRLDVDSGARATVVGGPRQVLDLSGTAAGARLAYTSGAALDPGDVRTCAWEGGDERRLTAADASLRAARAWPRITRRTFRVSHPDGAIELDGWLLVPPAGEGPFPLLVSVHGGPHGYVGEAFSAGHFYRYVLATRGWAVLALNPSGSGSYGKDFAHSIRGRWGERDLPELLAATDALIADGTADPARLAIAGYSYGGYLAAWAVAHTDRFHAAVVGGAITNLESFCGTSDIGPWFVPWELRASASEGREVYRRLSPVTYAARVQTPTLILHGEADERCPIGQAEELFSALVMAGRAPAEFVRYPRASHLFSASGRPSHRIDYHRRVVEWIERHAGARRP